MGRLFGHLLLTREACVGLREAVRPFAKVDREDSLLPFCERLYLAFYSLEADLDKEVEDFPVELNDLFVINHFVSSEEGAWAKDVLHQTRQALFELCTGKPAARLVSADQVSSLLEGVRIDLNDEERGEKDR